MGSSIHLGAGESAGDTSLMAHEAAHTIQQSGGAVQAKSDGTRSISQPGDPLEREADAVADAVMSGGTASISAGNGSSGAIQRDVVSDVESKLSYGAFDWAITDSDAEQVSRIVMAL